MEVQESQEAVEEPLVESQRPRVSLKVPKPSAAEVEEHEASGCAVYRTWCPHCVAAQGRGNPHKSHGEVSEVPEIGFDYGYMSRDAKSAPMICVRDSKSQSHAATFVPKKGRDSYAVAFLVAFVRGLGYKT